MEYVDGGTVILLEKDSSCPSLNRALNSSGEPSSLMRTTNTPLAGDLAMNCPIMTMSLPLVLAVTF